MRTLADAWSWYRATKQNSPVEASLSNSLHGVIGPQVDQVRDYRNWVAHGRRDAPTNNVTPEMAYDRLGEFLAALGISVEREAESFDESVEEQE